MIDFFIKNVKRGAHPWALCFTYPEYHAGLERILQRPLSKKTVWILGKYGTYNQTKTKLTQKRRGILSGRLTIDDLYLRIHRRTEQGLAFTYEKPRLR